MRALPTIKSITLLPSKRKTRYIQVKMTQIIVNYSLRKGETLEEAMWSSGIYRKKDMRTFKEVAEGKPKEELTFYDSAYLVNGRCHNCSASPAKPHPPHCPGSYMKAIKNIIVPLCPICNYSRIEGDQQFCYSCEEDAEFCSCYTPGYCQDTDTHDQAYYEKKRAEWKAELASAGIALD